MPYSTGETPEVGDQIFDLQQRYGIVTHIVMWGSAQSELIIEWEDGTIGIRYTVLEDSELLSRRSGKENVLSER